MHHVMLTPLPHVGNHNVFFYKVSIILDTFQMGYASLLNPNNEHNEILISIYVWLL